VLLVVVALVDPGSTFTLARPSCSFSPVSCGWTSLVSTVTDAMRYAV